MKKEDLDEVEAEFKKIRDADPLSVMNARIMELALEGKPEQVGVPDIYIKMLLAIGIDAAITFLVTNDVVSVSKLMETNEALRG